MEKIIQLLESFNHNMHQLIWGPWMLLLFLAVGLYFSVKTRFFQIRKFKLWWSKTLGACLFDKSIRETGDKHAISQFQSLCTALAATAGTGNIAGVATAIVAGGPGAIFWMWISAILGMMTIYAENILGMKYRYRNQQGQWLGGPMVYIERGMKCRFLAVLFAVFCVLASFGMGNMAQANSIANTLEYAFDIPLLITGIGLAAITGIVIIGGIKRISAVAEKIIPIAASLYTLLALIVLLGCIERLPQAISLIFTEAFNFQSAAGGVAGYGISKAIRYGISRGVFSNEAGLGSSVMIHAAADTKSPETQGMWGILEIFIDTIVMCTITGLVILCAGIYDLNSLGQISSGVEVLNGAALTADSFSAVLGSLGEYIIAISMLFFAFATLVGWSYLGRQAVEYLFGIKAIVFYQWIFIGVIILGCISTLDLVWELSDIFNGLMALPNLIALIWLRKEVGGGPES